MFSACGFSVENAFSPKTCVLDNRGSGGRGVRFETASFHRLGAVEVQDQVAGVRWLRSLPYVDPQRIGIFGWSYGGYMALQCVLHAPESFAAAAAGAPVTDWRLYDTHYTERYMGTPQQNPDGYAAAGVLGYAAGLSRPLLLMRGMADDNVLFQHTTLLLQSLQKENRPFQFMAYPGGKHGSSVMPIRDRTPSRRYSSSSGANWARHGRPRRSPAAARALAGRGDVSRSCRRRPSTGAHRAFQRRSLYP